METRRTLLKVSGEALTGDAEHGLCPRTLDLVGKEIADCAREGFQIVTVVGGGNYMRGATSERLGLDRGRLDHMGMLATAMNALALGGAVARYDATVRVMTTISGVAGFESYSAPVARRALESNEVVILGGGLGAPYCTTDTAAIIRGLELHVDEVLKATLVDGVFERDAHAAPNGVHFSRLTYSDALQAELAVMDSAAMAIGREHGLPIRIFSMHAIENIGAAIRGANLGTKIRADGPIRKAAPLRVA